MTKKKTISLKTMMTGMMTKMKFTSLSKSQCSTKRRKKRSPFEQHKRRKRLRSVEPNGSATSDCHDLDGVLHTVWTASNVETTSTEVHLFVLDTVRLQPLVGFTQVAFKKSWFTTLTISNQSIPRHRQLESDVPLVAESVRTFTPVLMN